MSGRRLSQKPKETFMNPRLSLFRSRHPAALAFLLPFAVHATGCARDKQEAAAEEPLVAIEHSLVISQVFAAGGEERAAFHYDFIELFNRGTRDVRLAGSFLQYAPADAPFKQDARVAVAWLPNRTLAPGQYFLIRLGSRPGPSGEEPEPPPPADDVDGGAPDTAPEADYIWPGKLNLDMRSGKIVLGWGSRRPSDAGKDPAELYDDCGGADGPRCTEWRDLVGYGSASQAEGKPVANLAADTAAIRSDNGCKDTDDNSADFTVGAPTPRNARSTRAVCPEMQGPPGPPGPHGDAGPQGAAGAAGKDGKDGKDGQNGADGKAGAEGPQGEGLAGAPGPADKNGKDLAPGESACAVTAGRSPSNMTALAGLAIAIAALGRRRKR
jgi:MYXO-CTERM domain-containing protein